MTGHRMLMATSIWVIKKKKNLGDCLELADIPTKLLISSGHALNKILKDIILRYKVLQGHKVQ